jgi:hypothetical protein
MTIDKCSQASCNTVVVATNTPEGPEAETLFRIDHRPRYISGIRFRKQKYVGEVESGVDTAEFRRATSRYALASDHE